MTEKLNQEYVDICIVGGGAAGLVSAVVAGEKSSGSGKVLLLEKGPKVGRKLSATGNGRGNLSNLKCQDWERTCGFFSSIGIMTKTDEEGRIYPKSEDAKDITARLEREALKAGVEIRTQCHVESIEKTEEGFLLKVTDKSLEEPREERIICKALLIATGGKSAPTYGSTGDGFRFAKDLGHKVSRLAPALTPVETSESIEEMGISGVRAEAVATLYKNNLEVSKEKGQVQFTDYGLSGICIFDLTKAMTIDEDADPVVGLKEYSIGLDLIPEMSEEEVALWIEDRKKAGDEGEEILQSLINKKLASAIVKMPGGIEPCKLKDLRFSVKNLKGWEKAQVTRGGVSLTEVDMTTMESKLVPGLYFAGEVLDYAGPCGGFNLQFAWTTGINSGKALRNTLEANKEKE